MLNKFISKLNTLLSTYNANIRLYFLASFFMQLGMGIFMVMYNLYIDSLGYPKQMNGNIISMTSLASAIILIPAGILSDRIGRKKTLIIGGVFGVLTFMIRAIAEGKTHLISFAFLSGIFMAFIQVSIIPFLAENSDKNQRVSLFSINAALVMLSTMFGNILGGAFADLFQFYFHYSEVMALKFTLIIGVFFQSIALIPIFKMKENKSKDYGARPSFLVNIRENKSQLKVILKFTLASLIIGFGAGLVIPYLNLYFSDRFHATKSSIGIIVSLGQLATALAMFIGPWMVKKLGEVRSVVILQLSSIPFLLLTGFTNSLTLAGLGFLFRQALMNAGNPIQQSLIMGRISDNMKGLANSLSGMVFNLGWALMGPVSTSIVAYGGSYYGYAIVFALTALLYVIGSSYFYFVFGRKYGKENINRDIPA